MCEERGADSVFLAFDMRGACDPSASGSSGPYFKSLVSVE